MLSARLFGLPKRSQQGKTVLTLTAVNQMGGGVEFDLDRTLSNVQVADELWKRPFCSIE